MRGVDEFLHSLDVKNRTDLKQREHSIGSYRASCMRGGLIPRECKTSLPARICTGVSEGISVKTRRES